MERASSAHGCLYKVARHKLTYLVLSGIASTASLDSSSERQDQVGVVLRLACMVPLLRQTCVFQRDTRLIWMYVRLRMHSTSVGIDLGCTCLWPTPVDDCNVVLLILLFYYF
jgi:hypothetical protein